MGSDETSVSNKKIFTRDSYKCKNCRREGGDKGNVELHAHHIVPKERGGQDRLSNLVTICKECHESVHQATSAPTVETEDITEYSDSSTDNVEDNRPNRNKRTGGRKKLSDFDGEQKDSN